MHELAGEAQAGARGAGDIDSTERLLKMYVLIFFFSSRRRHTRFDCDWSSDVCSSDLAFVRAKVRNAARRERTIAVRTFARTKARHFAGQYFRRRYRQASGRSRAVLAKIGRASCRERV